jgi:hypothetical protein
MRHNVIRKNERLELIIMRDLIIVKILCTLYLIETFDTSLGKSRYSRLYDTYER